MDVSFKGGGDLFFNLNTLMPLITWTGPNVPDGSQHTGVCPCEKRPSAHCWDWTQITTCLLPCHGTLSGDLHACTKTGTGMKHMTCMKLFYTWGSGCELVESVLALSVSFNSPFCRNGGFCAHV